MTDICFFTEIIQIAHAMQYNEFILCQNSNSLFFCAIWKRTYCHKIQMVNLSKRGPQERKNKNGIVAPYLLFLEALNFRGLNERISFRIKIELLWNWCYALPWIPDLHNKPCGDLLSLSSSHRLILRKLTAVQDRCSVDKKYLWNHSQAAIASTL